MDDQERVRLEVEALLGRRVWGWGQVLGMLQLGFGDLIDSEVQFGPKRGTRVETSELILHAQAMWSVYEADALVLEYGPDCFDRDNDEPFWNEAKDLPNGETSAESRGILQRAIGLGDRVVESIDVTERLGPHIEVSGGVRIRIKGPRFDGEEWRLFETAVRNKHFVVEQVDEGPDVGQLKVSWH